MWIHLSQCESDDDEDDDEDDEYDEDDDGDDWFFFGFWNNVPNIMNIKVKGQTDLKIVCN